MRFGIMAAARGGSNTLRGGKNQYNAKTLNDNWVEDRYDPVFEGVRPSCATTAAKQDMEGVCARCGVGACGWARAWLLWQPWRPDCIGALTRAAALRGSSQQLRRPRCGTAASCSTRPSLTTPLTTATQSGTTRRRTQRSGRVSRTRCTRPRRPRSRQSSPRRSAWARPSSRTRTRQTSTVAHGEA